jgi:hypothetical protein
MLRKFETVILVDKLVLDLDDKTAWIFFHGDVFDASEPCKMDRH